MKKLPTTAKALVIPAVCVAGILTLQAFASEKPKSKDFDAPFVLNFKEPVKIKADKDVFKAALDMHTKDKKSYHATYDGEVIKPTLSQMKTEKVTRGDGSPVPAATAAASGVNVTQKAGFATLDDLQNFVKAIK